MTSGQCDLGLASVLLEASDVCAPRSLSNYCRNLVRRFGVNFTEKADMGISPKNNWETSEMTREVILNVFVQANEHENYKKTFLFLSTKFLTENQIAIQNSTRVRQDGHLYYQTKKQILKDRRLEKVLSTSDGTKRVLDIDIESKLEIEFIRLLPRQAKSLQQLEIYFEGLDTGATDSLLACLPATYCADSCTLIDHQRRQAPHLLRYPTQ